MKIGSALQVLEVGRGGHDRRNVIAASRLVDTRQEMAIA
jgi:hypothetical protein